MLELYFAILLIAHVSSWKVRNSQSLESRNQNPTYSSLIPRPLPNQEKGPGIHSMRMRQLDHKNLVIEILTQNIRICSSKLLVTRLFAPCTMTSLVLWPLVCSDILVFVNCLVIVWWNTGVLAVKLHAPSSRPFYEKFCQLHISIGGYDCDWHVCRAKRSVNGVGYFNKLCTSPYLLPTPTLPYVAVVKLFVNFTVTFQILGQTHVAKYMG